MIIYLILVGFMSGDNAAKEGGAGIVEKRENGEKVYALKIGGSPAEQERIFGEIREKLTPYGDNVKYVVLPGDVTTLDFYLKECEFRLRERALEMVEKFGLEFIKVGVPALIEEVMKYVFGGGEKKQ
jgi:hypothetical protein